MFSTLRNLREFFFWLADLPGFKSSYRLRRRGLFQSKRQGCGDRPSAPGEARPERWTRFSIVLRTMPANTALERRDRALIALAVLTGARIGALASFRHGHINLDQGYVEQDARTVRTKFSKTFRTYFLPVNDEALAVFTDWHEELRRDHLWGLADPLFPATEVGLGSDGGFARVGLSRRAWSTSAPVREIFKRAFESPIYPITTLTPSGICSFGMPSRSISALSK